MYTSCRLAMSRELLAAHVWHLRYVRRSHGCCSMARCAAALPDLLHRAGAPWDSAWTWIAALPGRRVQPIEQADDAFVASLGAWLSHVRRGIRRCFRAIVAAAGQAEHTLKEPPRRALPSACLRSFFAAAVKHTPQTVRGALLTGHIREEPGGGVLGAQEGSAWCARADDEEGDRHTLCRAWYRS